MKWVKTSYNRKHPVISLVPGRYFIVENFTSSWPITARTHQSSTFAYWLSNSTWFENIMRNWKKRNSHYFVDNSSLSSKQNEEPSSGSSNFILFLFNEQVSLFFRLILSKHIAHYFQHVLANRKTSFSSVGKRLDSMQEWKCNRKENYWSQS